MDSCLFYALISNKSILLYMTGMPKTVLRVSCNLNLMGQQEITWHKKLEKNIVLLYCIIHFCGLL